MIHFSRNKSDPVGFGNEIYSWLLHLRKKILVIYSYLVEGLLTTVPIFMKKSFGVCFSLLILSFIGLG